MESEVPTLLNKNLSHKVKQGELFPLSEEFPLKLKEFWLSFDLSVYHDLSCLKDFKLTLRVQMIAPPQLCRSHPLFTEGLN